MLRQVMPVYAKFHNLAVGEESIDLAIDLSMKYMLDKKLPDKAIDVIDEAGAAQRILPKSKQKKNIGSKEIEDVIGLVAPSPSAQKERPMMLSHKSRSFARSSSDPDPFSRSLRICTSHHVPSRQGVHFPHDSCL